MNRIPDPLWERFEEGLKLLTEASALAEPRSGCQRVDPTPAAITLACEAVRNFLDVFAAAAERRLPDPEGRLVRLRNQCEALLNTGQTPRDALKHALEAGRLAREEAIRLLPRLTD